jgi:CO/xanthine dehydrogenase Mo-binding subunit
MIRNDLPRSLIDNPTLDRWVGFEGAGGVRLGTGKVELGQGVLTALRQIAAEELQVEPDRIRVVSGETGTAPEEGMTAGSQSIEASGGSIRLVCAEVRAMAAAAAAARLGCSEVELSLDDGHFLRNGRPSGESYWTLADRLDLGRHATGSVAPLPAGQHRIIGRSVPRIDLPDKLCGPGFIHDLRPDGLVHARVLRTPSRGARIASVDAERIQRAAGAPLTIVRIDDFLAFVADDEAAAERALEAAAGAVTWSGVTAGQPSDADPRHLLTLPTIDRVVTAPGRAASAGGGAVVEATYTRPYIAHASIAPSCALALWDGAALTVWSHSQGVGPLRNSIARTLKLDPANITVLHRPGAGCYGHNGADDAALDAALIAHRTPGRPIRVRWTREDELSAAPVGGASVVHLRAELDNTGRPATWDMAIWSPSHGQRPGANGGINLLAELALADSEQSGGADDVPDAAGGGGNRNSVALYDLPEQRVLHHLVTQPPLRTSSLRGLGTQANVFAIESFIDELAEAAGRDPVQYRLALMTDPRARRVIEAASEMSPWNDRAAPGSGTGLGLAFSRYKNRAAYLAAVAEVEVDESVRVRRVWCAVDAGLVINPDGAANQIEGGAVQATSWTLREQVRTDEQGIASRRWESYPILRFSEVPEVQTRFVGSPDDPPLGLGEVALGPVTAAIGNAVAHALGARIRDLPFSRDRLLASLLQETT